MILQWRKLVWGVDYTVWCFVSKWRCLDCQLKALQCWWNSTHSYTGAYGEVLSQTEKKKKIICTALENNWKVRTLIKGVVQKYQNIFQNTQGSLSSIEHQENGKQEWSWIRYQTPGTSANNEDIWITNIILNYKYHTELSSSDSSPHCQVI